LGGGDARGGQAQRFVLRLGSTRGSRLLRCRLSGTGPFGIL
jgi:hypothetical protein